MDEITLVETCYYCEDEDDIHSPYCSMCNGTGEIITENGKQLLKFVRKHMFTEVDVD